MPSSTEIVVGEDSKVNLLETLAENKNKEAGNKLKFICTSLRNYSLTAINASSAERSSE